MSKEEKLKSLVRAPELVLPPLFNFAQKLLKHWQFVKRFRYSPRCRPNAGRFFVKQNGTTLYRHDGKLYHKLKRIVCKIFTSTRDRNPPQAFLVTILRCALKIGRVNIRTVLPSDNVHFYDSIATGNEILFRVILENTRTTEIMASSCIFRKKGAKTVLNQICFLLWE